MFRSVARLCAFVMLLFPVPTLIAQQVSGYAIIDGTQNPPAVVESTVDFVIADNGTGNYTLTFDQPVVFLLGTSLTEGPGFDVAPSFLSATVDSLNPNKANIAIRYVTGNHFALDGQFSIEVRLAEPPP